jgi:hypothetical protein
VHQAAVWSERKLRDAGCGSRSRFRVRTKAADDEGNCEPSSRVFFEQTAPKRANSLCNINQGGINAQICSEASRKCSDIQLQVSVPLLHGEAVKPQGSRHRKVDNGYKHRTWIHTDGGS